MRGGVCEREAGMSELRGGPLVGTDSLDRGQQAALLAVVDVDAATSVDLCVSSRLCAGGSACGARAGTDPT
jgi:hypothetical protein